MTAAEYLEIERAAELKSDYFRGMVIPRAPCNNRHNLIASNMMWIIGNQIRERDYFVFGSNMRLKIEAFEDYVYPDVSVVFGYGSYEDEKEDNLLNPVVLVEILSEATEAYDRGDKFQHYQFLKSLQEYILIAQDACRVEQFVRQHDWQWKYRIYSSLEDVVKLESIDCELPLKEVYLKVSDLAAS